MTNDDNDNRDNNETGDLTNGHLVSKPRLEEVDTLAEELATEYNNHNFLKWYCSLIYDFGIDRVKRWQAKSKSADSPGLVFASYVKQAKSLVANSKEDWKPGQRKPKVSPVPISSFPEESSARLALLNGMAEALGEKAESSELYNHLNPNGTRKGWGKK